MIKLLRSAVTFTCLISQISATPVPDESFETITDLVYHDESAASLFSDNLVIPEVVTLSLDQISNESVSQTEPFIPEGLQTREGDDYISGADDRVLFPRTDFPYAAVGRIYWSNGAVCTGALIGPRHILTAKHCIQSGVSGQFAPGFDETPKLGASYFTHTITVGGGETGECKYKADWAIVITTDRLGDKIGYFGVKTPDRSQVGNIGYDHIGYPGDRDNTFRPYRQSNQKLLDKEWSCGSDGPFWTDTDLAGGQSGGPFWETVGNNRYIWGVMAVGQKTGTWSRAGWASGSALVSTVGDMLKQFP